MSGTARSKYSAARDLFVPTGEDRDDRVGVVASIRAALRMKSDCNPKLS
jgi:hypothetical protein